MLTLSSHPTTFVLHIPSHVGAPNTAHQVSGRKISQKCARPQTLVKRTSGPLPTQPTDSPPTQTSPKPLPNLSQIYPVMGRKAPTAKELLEKAAARGTSREGCHKGDTQISPEDSQRSKLGVGPLCEVCEVCVALVMTSQ